MTSRRFVAPASSMTMRSMPGAMPPCGGAPYWKRVSMPPNLRLHIGLRSPAISKAFTIVSGGGYAPRPTTSSKPLQTMSYW